MPNPAKKYILRNTHTSLFFGYENHNYLKSLVLCHSTGLLRNRKHLSKSDLKSAPNHFIRGGRVDFPSLNTQTFPKIPLLLVKSEIIISVNFLGLIFYRSTLGPPCDHKMKKIKNPALLRIFYGY